MNAVEFVTAAAHAGAGARREPLPPLDGPELWPIVVDLAIEHRVAPLVAEGLAHSGAGAASAPEGVRDSLRAEVLRSGATRLLCESTLRDVVGNLRRRGVEIIVLKGPSVAHSVYPRPELRIYHDLDVLCRVDDYRALHQALVENGYTSADTEERAGAHDRLATKPSPSESHSVRGFYDPSGNVKIEVHFDALQLGLRDRYEEQFWRLSQKLEVNGCEIRVLSPEHQFLHLAVHAHRHGYSRLSWLIELDLLVRRSHSSLDWAEVAEVARGEGVGTALRHALATSHAVLGTPVPELPRPTFEERCLGACYRALWPFARTRQLRQREHHRLLQFLPDAPDARRVLYGLVLVGRRGEKIRALVRRRWPRAHRAAAR
jgi:hypothetical protein